MWSTGRQVKRKLQQTKKQRSENNNASGKKIRNSGFETYHNGTSKRTQ